MLLSHVGPVPLGLQKQGLSALFRCWVRRLQTGDRPHISGIYLINIFENQSVAAASVLFCCLTSRNQKPRSDARWGNQLTVCFSKCMSTKNRRIPCGIQRQLTSIPAPYIMAQIKPLISHWMLLHPVAHGVADVCSICFTYEGLFCLPLSFVTNFTGLFWVCQLVRRILFCSLFIRCIFSNYISIIISFSHTIVVNPLIFLKRL